MIHSNKIYRACIYVRVSTEEQAENPDGSIRNQEENLKKQLEIKKSQGLTIELFDVFVDAGLSAKDMNRPALQRLLRKVEKKEINLVMVTEISRLSRSTKDFCMMWEFFQKHNCELYSLREQFDTTNAAGELMLKSIANFAEFERRQTAERISNSFKSRAERGLYNGGPVPFGYKLPNPRNGSLEVDDPSAHIVRRAFQVFLENETLSDAAKDLNAQGLQLKSPMEGGGNRSRSEYFLVSTIHGILNNKAYIGIRSFQTKEGVKEVKASWAAIVDEKTFSLAQEKLAKNYQKKKPSTQISRYPYLLSGILVCGSCGKTLCGKSAHGRGKKYPFYEHAQVAKLQATLATPSYACQPHRFPGARVEDFLWDKVTSILEDPTTARAILKSAHKEHELEHNLENTKRLKDQCHKMNSQITSLTVRLSELPSDVNATPIYNQMKKLNLEKAKAEEQIKSIEFERDNRDFPIELANYESFLMALRQKKLCGLTAAEKIRIIEQLIHKVELFPKGMKIHHYVGKKRLTTAPESNSGASCTVLSGTLVGTRKESKKICEKNVSSSLTNGGPYRTRICDLYHVKVAL